MAAKRALVVDDSKSARAFLREVARRACSSKSMPPKRPNRPSTTCRAHRPDVIFMDHLMPGMDGFQAVQAIKNNPRTATIPILMYTSQEGELYLGPGARAGRGRRAAQAAWRRPTSARCWSSCTWCRSRSLVTIAVQQDVRGCRGSRRGSRWIPMCPPRRVRRSMKCCGMKWRHCAGIWPSRSSRTASGSVSDVRGLMVELMPAPPEAPPADPDSPGRSTLPWLLALAASVTAAVLGTLLWQHQQQLGYLEKRTGRQPFDGHPAGRKAGARAGAAARGGGPALAAAAAASGAELIARVPFGEAPLAGDRIDALRSFVARVATLGQKGTVEVRRHAGRFCLARSGTEGFCAGRCRHALQQVRPGGRSHRPAAGQCRHGIRGLRQRAGRPAPAA